MKPTVDRVIHESESVAITMDGYVPIDIKIADSKNLPPLYWRVGNGNKSLLELAVLPENGFLASITLVMIESDSVHKADCLPVHLEAREGGFPIFNTDVWKYTESGDFSQRFIDDFSLDIQVKISLDSILLIIGEKKISSNWIKCSDNFYMGLDDERHIVNIYLTKLTENDMKRFFETVG